MSYSVDPEGDPLEPFLSDPIFSDDQAPNHIGGGEPNGSELSDTEDDGMDPALLEPPRPQAPAEFLVFRDVLGDEAKEKRNDVIYIGDYKSAQRNVIFFHGDCQDYPEAMRNDEFANKWCEYSLYRVAQMLHEKFRNDNVFIIKASRMMYQAYTVYQNFVACDEYGTPQYMADCGAFQQMALLLQSLQTLLRRHFVTVTHIEKPLVLVGFSKGCVVLNQCLYELLAMTSLASCPGHTLSKHLSSMYWLDGGHNGRTDTWVGNERVLRHLAVSTEIGVHVHVTPYQMKDPDRSWIARQQRKFVQTQVKHGRAPHETKHFFHETRDLAQHFRLLQVFQP